VGTAVAGEEKIFTIANLIASGGRVDDEDDEPVAKAKPRDKDTIEPVFFHALPETFHNELSGCHALGWGVGSLSRQRGVGIGSLQE